MALIRGVRSRSGRYITHSRFGRYKYSLSTRDSFKAFKSYGRYKRFSRSIRRF